MHMLRTADFDVFMMPDNLPRENITNLVKDFWLSGGGILAFDSSGLFLCYMGILPPESAGSDGYSTYWVYSGQDVNITTRNPVSKSYSLGNVTPTDSGYSYFVLEMVCTQRLFYCGQSNESR